MTRPSLANPARFQRLAAALVPWCAGLAAVTLAAGLVLALGLSPPDYRQGQAVRIMYVHVPAAWMALGLYTAMAAAAVLALVWKHPLAGLFVRAAAPVGAGFTALCLITGSLWGAPMWGTWWVWDARLTSVLILFFLYLGYIALANAFDDAERGTRAGNLLVLVGAINIPVIKFSVDWWNTLHQPASVSRLAAPAIDPALLAPLLVMALGFALYAATVLLIRLQSEILARKIRSVRLTDINISTIAIVYMALLSSIIGSSPAMAAETVGYDGISFGMNGMNVAQRPEQQRGAGKRPVAGYDAFLFDMSLRQFYRIVEMEQIKILDVAGDGNDEDISFSYPIGGKNGVASVGFTDNKLKRIIILYFSDHNQKGNDDCNKVFNGALSNLILDCEGGSTRYYCSGYHENAEDFF